MSIREWKPTDRQEDFLSIPDSVFEGLYGGAAGGGKTECLLMHPLAKNTKEGKPVYTHPRYKALFLRRTYPELDNEVIPRSKEFYPSTGALPYQDQKKRWTWPSGAILQFGHCENEKDVYRYDTSEFTHILWDEATSFTPYQYEYLSFSRCRTASPELTAITRAGTNPGNIGHSYFRKRFVAPNRNGNVILKEVRTLKGVTSTLLRIFIPSKVTDNPYLLKNDPDYVTRLNKLPEKDRAAKADGDWWAFSGQVFDDFREFHLETEPANALHVCKPFKIPDYWPVVLSIDWGYSALTVAGFYAINPVPDKNKPAKIYKCEEFSCLKTNISSWAKSVAEIAKKYNIVDIVLDPSAWGHRGDEYTISEQFYLVSGLTPRKADNDRISGKLAIQEYLRWSPRIGEISPGEIILLPRLQIFDTCTETIKVLPLCMYKKDKQKQVTDKDDEGNSEDVEEFRGDDAYDETRYGIKACQYYLDNGVLEHQQIARTSAICSIIEQPNPSPSEITTFYRKMADLEYEQAVSNRPTRRYHGTRLRHANF